MKRIVALTITLLLASGNFLASADTDEGHVNGLPKLSDYAPAGPTCKRKVKLNAWLTTPAVEFLKTSRCVIGLSTCTGVKKYKSEPRPDKSATCEDYRKVLDALTNREMCCDSAQK